LIIIEDDPYSFIELPSYSKPGSPLPELLGTSKLTPSLFSLDDEGRVIHMFTFSKVLGMSTSHYLYSSILMRL
jgi:DNA-binding transcriptional MocR family regulator